MNKREILLAFAITRVGFIIVALLALTWLPGDHVSGSRHVSNDPLIDMWSRWDSGFYEAIAIYGYGWQQGRETADATFLPLYPLLMRGLSRLVSPSPAPEAVTVVGVLLSNVSLLLSLFALDALFALDGLSPGVRRLALWLFLLAPATFFFSAVYTEGLYFLLSVTALWAARRRYWQLAGLAGLLAAFTRVVGWTLVLPLAWEAWRQFKERPRLASAGLYSSALLPALGLPSYAAAVGLRLRAPRAYFWITASQWHQGVTLPWHAFTDYLLGPLVLHGVGHSLFDLAFTLLFIALALLSFRLRIDYGLYASAVVWFPILSGTLVSMPRYVAVAFPAYAVLAVWAHGHRWRTIALLAASALLAIWAAAWFVTWHWVA